MENVRYSGSLQQFNNEILRIGGSPYGTCWQIATCEMKRRGLDKAHVLEFGCGEGHASQILLRGTDVTMDLLDINPQMLDRARQDLCMFHHRTKFFQADVHDFLKTVGRGRRYEVIFSSFVMHNFPRPERQKLLAECHAAMWRGGTFILNDSIPVDHGDEQMLMRQLRRYRYLPEAVRDDIIEHVTQDAQPPYYMPSRQIRDDLEDAGFKNITLEDRVEREALIFANA